MRLLVLATSLAIAASAATQQPDVPEPPSEKLLAGGRNPVVSYLMQAYGLSEADAQERVAVQAEVMELAQRLERENDPAYADIWIEHEPVYKVAIAFLDKDDRKAFKDSLSPRLRRYVQIVPVSKSKKQRNQELEELSSTLRRANIPFDGLFEGKKQRFTVGVANASDLARAESVIPASLRGEVDLVVKKLPKPEGPPTGVVAGDYIAGGYAVWITDDPAHTNPTQCTFGFPVRYGANRLPGVLTAGHCSVPPPKIFASKYGNPAHFIKFDWAAPIMRKNEGPYDYMVVQGSTALGDDGCLRHFLSEPEQPGARSYGKLL